MLLYLFSINRHFAPWLLLGSCTWLSWQSCQYLPFSMHLLVTLSTVFLVFSRVIKGLFFSPQNHDKSTSVPKPNYQTWLECKKGSAAFLSLPKGQARILLVRDSDDLKLLCLPSQEGNLSERGTSCQKIKGWCFLEAVSKSWRYFIQDHHLHLFRMNQLWMKVTF